MSTYYWVLPDNKTFAEIKAKSLHTATQVAKLWRDDPIYRIYTPSQKVSFALFAFSEPLKAMTLDEVSNKIKTYRYEIVNLETKQVISCGSIKCIPEHYDKECKKLIGSTADRKQRFKLGHMVWMPPSKHCMFINKTHKKGLFIENHAIFMPMLTINP